MSNDMIDNISRHHITDEQKRMDAERREQQSALERDARRYRWLRDNAAVAESVMAHNKGHRRAILDFEAPDLDLDAAIDRAMGGE